MYFDGYENYYNEPSEVDELFNEFSEKLKRNVEEHRRT